MTVTPLADAVGLTAGACEALCTSQDGCAAYNFDTAATPSCKTVTTTTGEIVGESSLGKHCYVRYEDSKIKYIKPSEFKGACVITGSNAAPSSQITASVILTDLACRYKCDDLAGCTSYHWDSAT